MARVYSAERLPRITPSEFSSAEKYTFRLETRPGGETARRRAVEICDRLRPGHVLGGGEWDCYYLSSAGDVRVLADFLPTVGVPKAIDYETRGWAPVVLRANVFGGHTKTKGVSPAHPDHRAIPVIIQISWGLDSYIVPAEFLHLLREWMETALDVDYANAGFEYHASMNVGIRPAVPYRDCLDMDFSFDETGRSFKHNLKQIAKDHLGLQVRSFKESTGNTGADNDFGLALSLNRRSAIEYAGLDPLITTLACDVLQGFLEGMEWETHPGMTLWDMYRHLERPHHRTVTEIERTRLPMSKAACRAHAERFIGEVEDADGELAAAAGRPINVSSSKELVNWLITEKGNLVRQTGNAQYCLACRKGINKTSNYRCREHGERFLVNAPSIDDAVLQAMALDGVREAEIIAGRRTSEKMLTSFSDKLFRFCDDDGWGYPTLRSNKVVSGRLAGDIWLTTPKALRDVYGFYPDVYPEHRGFVWLRFDYSQVELRVMAHLSEDPIMLKAYREEKDLHCFAAGLILLLREHPEKIADADYQERYYQECSQAVQKNSDNKDLKKADQRVVPLSERESLLVALRSNAKTVNFGIVYGMGPSRYARKEHVSLKAASELFDAVWSLYKAIPPYFKRRVEDATAKLYLSTLLGRRKRLPALGGDDIRQKAAEERLTQNVPCQGGAADIMRCARILVCMDIEAGKPPRPGRPGVYGDWDKDGQYSPAFDRLPLGWEDKMPERWAEDPGALGRLGAEVMLEVHDELNFRCPEENAEAVMIRVPALMEHPLGGAAHFRTPLKVSQGYARTWKDAD